jgi:hypothetical protein
MKINFDYDIPYAGGYSVDGQTIYIDKDIPEYFTAYDGKIYPLRAILINHEHAESVWLQLEPGKTYNEAHLEATKEDIEYMLDRDIPVDEYYGALAWHVDHCLHKWQEGVAKLPPDLDMRPYIEDGLME